MGSQGWIYVVTVWIAGGCISTGPNVTVRPPRPDLTPDQRVATYDELHGVSETEAIVSNCSINGCKTADDQLSMRLANGVTIHHPEDLLPLVSPDSEMARHVRATRSALIKIVLWGAAGAVAMAAGGYLYIKESAARNDPSAHTTGKYVAGGLFFSGMLGEVVAYHYRSRVLDETDLAFRAYSADLARTLRVCVNGFEVVACESSLRNNSNRVVPTTDPPVAQ